MIKTISLEDIMRVYAVDDQEKINKLLERTDVDGLIVFENMQMDSSSFAARSVVAYGPGCTYKSPADVEGKWLNDLPSQRQHPTYFYKKN